MSAASEARLRRPRTRGAFMPLDAASRQLALLSVANPGGDARLYWLVELPALTVSDTRFLAFGALSGHAVMDAFSELARGRSERIMRRQVLQPLPPGCRRRRRAAKAHQILIARRKEGRAEHVGEQMVREGHDQKP